MKTIIIFALTFIVSLSIMAQTSLDSLLFEKINIYRTANGLPELSWDTAVYKMSKHHTLYLNQYAKQNNFNIMIIGHNETNDIEGFEEINLMSDRFNKYVGVNYNHIVENVSGGGKIGVLTKSNSLNSTNKDLIVNYIIKSWINSPKHNQALLSNKIIYGACSIRLYFINNNMGSYIPIITGATYNAYK